MVYACALVSPEVIELRAQLGGEDTAVALRSPEKCELLNRLADAVSGAELVKFRAR